MLNRIMRNYEDYYSVVFSKASECMRQVFGIDMIQVDSFVHSYILDTALGITYERMLHGILGVPKMGLIIQLSCISSS